MTFRPILTKYRNPALHWVGDGFLTQGMLPYQQHAADTSPFLLAGYNPAMWFDATQQPKGVGLHPHRGFETVTIVYQGGVDHMDTSGNRGTIGPGDVQWMTAARGVQHQEFHSDLINRAGGTLEMVQLWINLPADQKLKDPGYQTLESQTIPEVALPQGGKLRVIAGHFDGTTGPARTSSPIDLWDGSLPQGAGQVIDLPADQTVALLVLKGKVQLNDQDVLEGPDTVIFRREAGEIHIKALEDVQFLLLAGMPLNEPIAMSGPFVMNTEAELRHAYADFRAGLF